MLLIADKPVPPILAAPQEIQDLLLFFYFSPFTWQWKAMLRERQILSLVCKGFLLVVRSNAHFWTTVHIRLETPPSFLHRSLSRSRHALLDLHICVSRSTARSAADVHRYHGGDMDVPFYRDTLPVVASVAFRVRVLSVRCDTHSEWRAIMAAATTASALESLTIVVLSFYAGSGGYLPVPFPSTRLHTLRISRLDFMVGFPYRGLINLHLSGLHRVSWGALATTFQQTPNLETLQLLDITVVDLAISTSVTLVALQYLVVVYNSESLATALGRIQMPALRSIRLDVHWTVSLALLVEQFSGLALATSVDINYFNGPDIGLLLNSLHVATDIDFIRSSPVVPSLVKHALRHSVMWTNNSFFRRIRVNGYLSEDEATTTLLRTRNVSLISLPPWVWFSGEWDRLYTFTTALVDGNRVTITSVSLIRVATSPQLFSMGRDLRSRPITAFSRVAEIGRRVKPMTHLRKQTEFAPILDHHLASRFHGLDGRASSPTVLDPNLERAPLRNGNEENAHSRELWIRFSCDLSHAGKQPKLLLNLLVSQSLALLASKTPAVGPTWVTSARDTQRTAIICGRSLRILAIPRCDTSRPEFVQSDIGPAPSRTSGFTVTQLGSSPTFLRANEQNSHYFTDLAIMCATIPGSGCDHGAVIASFDVAATHRESPLRRNC
ncbi:hypothetical protein B0H11DRAFT_1912369 [Mycena galericulata]|nr:hypothetical protein B0H11DRAFT_1912369 [Mycena galericulata]